MAATKEQKEEAKGYIELIKKAKGSAKIYFAVGKSSAGEAVHIDKKKAKACAAILKTRGISTPLAFGQLFFEDKLTLACVKQPNENAVRKAFWNYFKSHEVTVPGVTENTIVVLGPKDWNNEDEDQDAEAPAPPQQPAATAAAPPPEPSPQAAAPPPPPPPPQAAAPPPPPPPPNAAAGAALMEAYKKLLPQMSARADIKEALTKVVRQFQDEMRASAFDKARASLEQLTGLLQGPATAAAPKQDGNELVAAYKKLLPEMSRKAAESPASKDQLTRAAKQFEEALKAHRFDDAKRMLDELTRYLESEGPGDTSSSAEAQEFARRYDALKPGLSKAVSEGRGDTSKMRAGAMFCVEKANEKDFRTALKAVEQLEGLVAAALATAAPQPTTVLGTYRKTLLDFDAAKKAVFARIDSLKSRIPSELPDEADFADRLAEELHEMLGDIDDAVIDALNASEDEAEPVTATVKSKIDEAMNVLRSNPLIKHVDNNPFGVNVAIETTLGAVLTQVAKAMPAVA